VKTKIISIGYSVPPGHYSQEETFESTGYPKRFKRIFLESQIDERHFVMHPSELRKLSFQEQQEAYKEWSLRLSCEALENALDGRDPGEMGLLTYSTCTGFAPGPTIPHYVAGRFGMPHDIQIDNRTSHGCEASFPGMRRAYEYTELTGRPSASIACELCSLTYFPEPEGKPDPTNKFELLRSNAIFADGCSCVILGQDDNPKHPEIVDFLSYLDTRYLNDLGYTWRDGRLRVLLSPNVPDIAAELVDKSTTALLKKHNLSVEDIRYWAIHPPGASVLDKFRDGLGIPEEKMKYSREVLRRFGNCSSSTVGIVGKALITQELNPEGYLMMITVGPGMVANSALLKFG
jgi:predicted naringenin-chalcone synthase